MIRNYNMDINNTSSDYSNLSVKDGETWAGYEDGNLINDSSLGRAKVPGSNVTTSHVNAPTSYIQ